MVNAEENYNNMISGFVEHIINSPHKHYQSAKWVGLQMSSDIKGERVADCRAVDELLLLLMLACI